MINAIGNPTAMGDTGFVRDDKRGKGRMDLLPWNALIELSKLCQDGAEHYGEHNVDLGCPQKTLIDSAFRHLAQYTAGYTDEDHLVHALWNVAFAVENRINHPELIDIPWNKAEVKDG